MPRLILGIAFVVVVFTVFTLVDCLRIERARTRVFPKVVWFFIVLLVPVVGALLWYTVGRVSRRAAIQAGRVRTIGPDDDPDFLHRMNGTRTDRPAERQQPVSEETLRELEQSLADVDDDDTGRTDR